MEEVSLTPNVFLLTRASRDGMKYSSREVTASGSPRVQPMSYAADALRDIRRKVASVVFGRSTWTKYFAENR